MNSDHHPRINDPNTLNNRKEISLLIYYLNKQGLIRKSISISDLSKGLELIFGHNKSDYEHDLLKFDDSLNVTNRSKDYDHLGQFLSSLSSMVKFDMERHLWNNHLV